MKFKYVMKYFYSYGYRAVCLYSVSRYLRNRGWICRKLSNLVLLYCKHSTGVEISPHCVIGSNLTIAHGMNIVIGGNTMIGQNVIIYNGITFGASGRLNKADDGYWDQIPDYPTIGNNVIVYSGAKIIGGITIGNNCIIAANAVVNKDIPENSLVAGIPGKVIKKIAHIEIARIRKG